jgi:hypothetical protein
LQLNSCTKGGIHAAEAGLADSSFMVGLKTIASQAVQIQAQEWTILNSNPEDSARSRAEMFPIANEAGGSNPEDFTHIAIDACWLGVEPRCFL